jgi:hypothetical protein
VTEPRPPERPPLGSWGRFYLLVVAINVLVIALLYLFTVSFNVPLGKR